ncbi:hypothetical protein AAFF_G00210680 [Aldrovandia affinis]|uniref:Uncharacterized protein n=1 Tax=Aldrovandia affinis TaxID=143900 RepID=A0AAD7SWD7_9TELE|nr:hypothetical protein AAFF_G00210680 [Aldrovandia affinis]
MSPVQLQGDGSTCSPRTSANSSEKKMNVNKLNLLRLAPGGHVGRFCIWTEGAFSKLDELYGTWLKASTLNVDYKPAPGKSTCFKGLHNM